MALCWRSYHGNRSGSETGVRALQSSEITYKIQLATYLQPEKGRCRIITTRRHLALPLKVDFSEYVNQKGTETSLVSHLNAFKRSPKPVCLSFFGTATLAVSLSAHSSRFAWIRKSGDDCACAKSLAAQPRAFRSSNCASPGVYWGAVTGGYATTHQWACKYCKWDNIIRRLRGRKVVGPVTGTA